MTLEQEEALAKDIQIFHSDRDLIEFLGYDIFKTYALFEDFSKRTDERYEDLKARIQIYDESNSVRIDVRVKNYCNAIYLNYLEIMSRLNSDIFNTEGAAARNLDLTDAATNIRWKTFESQLAKYANFMINLDELSILAMVKQTGIVYFTPIPSSQAMYNYVMDTLNHDSKIVGLRSIIVNRLRKLNFYVIPRLNMMSIYKNPHPTASGTRTVGKVVPMRLYTVGPWRVRKVRDKMFKAAVKSHYLKKFKGEYQDGWDGILAKMDSDLNFSKDVAYLFNKLMVGNRDINFDKWMNDPNYLDNVEFSGLLPNKPINQVRKEREEYRMLRTTTRQDEKNWRLMERGIVPYSKFGKLVMPAEKFAKILNLEDCLDPNFQLRHKLDANGVDQMSSQQKEQACAAHNDEVRGRICTSKFIFTNLGKLKMTRLREVVELHPSALAICISEVYLESALLKDRLNWPDGYQVFCSDPSPVGELSFTVIIIKSTVKVSRQVSGLHQNCGVVIEIGQQEILLGCIYNFIKTSYNGYEKKFNATIDILYKDLEKLRDSHEGPSVIGGDFNVNCEVPRPGEKQKVEKILNILEGFQNNIDFLTNKMKNKEPSMIDFVFSRGIRVSESKPLNHHQL